MSTLLTTRSISPRPVIRALTPPSPQVLNDTHSQLNPAHPHAVFQPRTLDELLHGLQFARSMGTAIIASGSRHAMGGQQFLEAGLVLDLRSMNRVLRFDAHAGHIEVEAGLQWPELISWLQSKPEMADWGITQKQTGADQLTIGGAVSANIHGRGLKYQPFVQDIDQLTVVDAHGRLQICSRTQNRDLFRLVIGGYGLFGVIYSVRLRLTRRYQVRRTVELIRAPQLIDAFHARLAAGFTFGDWQFAIDSHSPDFLDLGVFSCYEPLERETEIPADQKALSPDAWNQLLHLAHADKSRGFQIYADHYLSTNGQLYWSDLHQLSPYVADYHRHVDCQTHAKVPGSEMITELYVPREKLAAFFIDARKALRERGASVIYGTVRLIERETETFLPWAREPWACIIFNLHIDHDPNSMARARDAFRALIDCALAQGGTYYLTYHRWATKSQLLQAYPNFPQFLAEKRHHDPHTVFQSNWHHHYAQPR